MSNDIPLTIVGNLTDNPVVREHEGRRFGSITVASTPRVFNRQANQWQDGTPTFMPVNLKDQHVRALEGGNIAKGSGVIVTGILKTRTWQDRESGKTRSRVELTAEHVGQWLLPPRGSGQAQSVRPGTTGDQSQGWDQGGTYEDETPW